MTVNHDVVGSSPTGGVRKRSLERFQIEDKRHFWRLFFVFKKIFCHII